MNKHKSNEIVNLSTKGGIVVKVKVTLTKKQFEVLQDVLSEIQESREYEGEDLAELGYLQMMFSYSHLYEFEKFDMISDDGKYGFEFIEE